MSAKDFLRRKKTRIQSTLTGNRQLIVDKCYEEGIITEADHINLSSINKGTETDYVTMLINNIRGKGEKRCKEFLDFLQKDEDIQEAFPQLEDILLEYTASLPNPVPESSSSAKKDDVRPDTKPKPEKDEPYPLNSNPTGLCFIINNVDFNDNKPRLGSDVDAVAKAEAITRSIAVLDGTEYYALTHNPRGWCVIINNEKFTGPQLNNRRGTQEDTKALTEVFTRLGFKVDVNINLTADEIRTKLQKLGREDFLDHDALVVCVLSHGEKGVVYGSDEHTVSLEELTQPFTCDRAPTLAGKPKLFFIEASQGYGYQTRGGLPCPPQPRQGELNLPLPETTTQVTVAYHHKGEIRLDEDTWATVASDADFLMGMATISGYKTFRNTATGSIYIQELCRQLMISAGSSEIDDILTILTRVNREVNKGEFLSHKQMPQPKYTLTKKLVLKFI